MFSGVNQQTLGGPTLQLLNVRFVHLERFSLEFQDKLVQKSVWRGISGLPFKSISAQVFFCGFESGSWRSSTSIPCVHRSISNYTTSHILSQFLSTDISHSQSQVIANFALHSKLLAVEIPRKIPGPSLDLHQADSCCTRDRCHGVFKMSLLWLRHLLKRHRSHDKLTL